MWVSTVAMLLACTTAGAADTRFSTSFESGDPAPATLAGEGVRVELGDGPERPYAAKPRAGYSGARALRYSAGGSGGRLQLFPVDIVIGDDTTLSWKVLPEIVEGDAGASTGVSLDLVFDDGQRLSGTALRDNHGVRPGAAGQAQSKTLYPQQWAHKAVRLGELKGRRIRAIELELRHGSGAGAVTRASGWLDDIAIGEQARSAATRPSDHVLTTRGTQANGTFSRGNNIPATAMPHGFNFWTPVTDAGTLGWLYRWNEQNGADNRPRLQALSLSHQPSPWMGDRQTFQVMPSAARGRPDADRARRALPFSHDRELARPHTYRVDFDNGIRAEIAPSERAAIFRFRFPREADANLLFDNVDHRGGLTLDAATQTLRGYTDTRSGLSNGAARMFVFARFDQRWQDSGALETGRPTGYIKFAAADGEVRMRIATSLISVEQAQRNLDQEIGGAGFEAVRERAQAAWDARLGRVRVQGASDDQLTTIYSNLYRLFLYPNVAHENVGSPDRPDWRHADQSNWLGTHSGGDALRSSAPVRAGKTYVNNGFWDTFRTTWPAYALFAPERAGEMIDGFLQQYRDGGWIARWSSPGYADLMVGTSSDVAFADAWLKGVRGFDAHQAYEAALRNATAVPPVSNVGRKGLARSMYRGYVDASVHEGLSWTLEGALNDFGLAQFATALAGEEGNPARARRYREEADYFRARAADYVHLFDPATGFFRGRDARGQWLQPAAGFEPRRWGGDYTEANAWNFAFTVPHDAEGLATLLGGRDTLARRLDEFFATAETAEPRFSGSYGQVIHEMTEARDVRMGMYAHSNQPSHHIPWMYVAAGQPWQTQRITREALARLYLGSEIGQGYAGDEDNGEMSAWYTFAMLGLYPLRMGAPEYVIGSPAFDRVEVRLDNGRTLTVIAHGNGPAQVYVQSLKVNGKPWPRPWIHHKDIAAGATLEFVMGSTPSSWGSDAGALPGSMSAPGVRPASVKDRSGRAEAVTLDGERTAGALVDDDASTSLSLQARSNVGFAFADPAAISHYTITGGKAPPHNLAWALEGRNGKGRWTVLDRRRQERFTWERQLRPFRVARPGAYREYRLRFENGATFELAELELLESGASAPAPGAAPDIRPAFTKIR
ncbi:GH92 family glycosyl hydrolase [Massilia niastensis]|uniref:GH92 family glycosyl hydrolase n=1 Tax=Massilia niastensis TaxID=544911 RepID=UPI00036F469A|nr:GH92 family glycosyl hydrolase [Massilia niastensis]